MGLAGISRCGFGGYWIAYYKRRTINELCIPRLLAKDNLRTCDEKLK